MSKKTKKAYVVIDGVLYRQIQWSNDSDTNWKSIPQNPSGILGSGLHRIDKNRKETHWDVYDGDKKIGKKPIEGDMPKFKSVLINFKSHGVFPAPSENHIVVLRGSDKPSGWISLKYYQKNKEKYFVKFGDKDHPDVVVEIGKVNQ
jgi:hypothetical protein